MVDSKDLIIVMLMVFFTLTTIVGNSLVIIAWFTQKSLRNPANAYIASLALADLLLGILVTSTNIPVQLKSDWTKDKLFCQTRLVVIGTLTTVSIFHLIAIAWDRYRTVMDGIQYIQRRSTKSVIQIVIMLWVVSIWIALPESLDYNQDKWPLNSCSYDGDLVWVIHSTFGAFIFPTFLMIKMYASVYSAIQERLRKRNLVQEDTEETLDQLEPKYKRRDKLEIPASLDSPKAQMTEEILNCLLSKERKAAKTLGIIMGAFLFCWFPFFMYHFFSSVFPAWRNLRLYRLLSFLGHANSAVNPLVYVIYNQEYQEAFKNILCCGRKWIGK